MMTIITTTIDITIIIITMDFVLMLFDLLLSIKGLNNYSRKSKHFYRQ